MKQELFKVNFEKYSTTGYHDTSSINDKKKHLWDKGDPEESYLPTPYEIEKKNYFKVKWQSNDEHLYETNYGNILSSVLKEYLMLVVEQTNNKVSMKLFRGMKTRRVGKQYFKIRRSVSYLTVDIIKGDVYYGNLNNYNTKRSRNSKIYKNSFLNDPISTLTSLFKNNLNLFGDSKLYGTFQTIVPAVHAFMNAIDKKLLEYENLTWDAMLFKFYLDKKKIKYPNNFYVFSKSLLGKKIRQCLKKSDNKLVDAYMMHYNLNGKKVKKALHRASHLNVLTYLQAVTLFGKDWVNQDDEQVSLELFNSSITFPFNNNMDEFKSFLSTEELKKVYKLYKQVHISKTLDAWTFHDHVNMFINLKRYGEHDLKWTSEISGTKFFNEHYDWTEKLDFYRMGNYYRTYPQYMYDLIQTQLETDDGVYYPILLDDTDKYNNESQTQSNCVKGYIGRAPSIIVSLRKGGQMSDDRATIEYRLTRENEKNVKIERVQTLGRFNQKLTEEWDSVVLKLDEIMLLSIKDKQFETVKLKKICANGIQLSCDSKWEDSGKLNWTQKIDNDDFYAV